MQETSDCPKCGDSHGPGRAKIQIDYCKGCREFGYTEHLHSRCPRCGYEEAEATVDHQRALAPDGPPDSEG